MARISISRLASLEATEAFIPLLNSIKCGNKRENYYKQNIIAQTAVFQLQFDRTRAASQAVRCNVLNVL